MTQTITLELDEIRDILNAISAELYRIGVRIAEATEDEDTERFDSEMKNETRYLQLEDTFRRLYETESARQPYTGVIIV